LKVSLNLLEIEALLSSAGAIDPRMFDEMDAVRGDKLFHAWQSGRAKLKQYLASGKAK